MVLKVYQHQNCSESDLHCSMETHAKKTKENQASVIKNAAPGHIPQTQRGPWLHPGLIKMLQKEENPNNPPHIGAHGFCFPGTGVLPSSADRSRSVFT